MDVNVLEFFNTDKALDIFKKFDWNLEKPINQNATIYERSNINQDLIKKWNSMKKKPKVIVFDLDYTLWQFFVGKDIKPPITREQEKNQTIVKDSKGFIMKPFDEVNQILYTLKNHCLDASNNEHLAIASRTSRKDLALETVTKFGWDKYFSSFQAYTKTKTIHMEAILEELKMTNYEDILFFDDE